MLLKGLLCGLRWAALLFGPAALVLWGDDIWSRFITPDNLFERYQTFFTGLIALIIGGLTIKGINKQSALEEWRHEAARYDQYASLTKTLENALFTYLADIKTGAGIMQNMFQEKSMNSKKAKKDAAVLLLSKPCPEIISDERFIAQMSQEDILTLTAIRAYLVSVETLSNLLCCADIQDTADKYLGVSKSIEDSADKIHRYENAVVAGLCGSFTHHKPRPVRPEA